MVAGLCADNIALLVESGRILQGFMDGFNSVCRRTRWVANADRDKLLVHEKPQTKTSDSGEPYRVKDESTKECSIQLSEEKMR